MNIFLLLPIVIPFLTAIFSLLLWNRWQWQRRLSVIGATLLLAAAGTLLVTVWREGIQAAQIGNWPAPYGITLVADLFSATLAVLTGLIGLAVAVYSLANIDEQRAQFGYYPLLHILLMGLSGAFLTGDLFNLFVWFEVLLIASFVLLALGGEPAQVQGAIKYVTLNLMASALFLAAVGILYGLAGTLNMADLARQFRTSAPPGLVTTLGILFLVAFGIKAAVVPLHFWLPSSYHTPPAPVSAIFAGLLTKVGVYALIRVFTLLFIQNTGYTHSIILIIAGLTMTVGILGAIAQNEFRRILSFNLISHIGYIIMGLGLFTPLALAGAIFYLIHDIIVKTNLFMIGGSIQRLQGTGELRKLGGLYVAYPSLALPFLIAAFSLAGVPPLSGFWPKLALLQAGLELRQYLIVIIALAVSLLTLLSMMRIWQEVFLKDRPDHSELETAAPLPASQWTASLLPILVLAAITVIIGLAAEPVFKLSMLTAEQLLDPTDYIQTVLNN